jgi:hypothetical protein
MRPLRVRLTTGQVWCLPLPYWLALTMWFTSDGKDCFTSRTEDADALITRLPDTIRLY